jgi:hypothetical protein
MFARKADLLKGTNTLLRGLLKQRKGDYNSED